MNKSQGYFLNALKSALDFLFTDFSAMFPKNTSLSLFTKQPAKHTTSSNHGLRTTE